MFQTFNIILIGGIIICIIILILLSKKIKAYQKEFIRLEKDCDGQKTFLAELAANNFTYRQSNAYLDQEKKKLESDIELEKQHLQSIQDDAEALRLSTNKDIEELRQAKMAQLEANYNFEQEKIKSKIAKSSAEAEQYFNEYKAQIEKVKKLGADAEQRLNSQLEQYQNLLDSLLAPLKLYEKEKQEKLFYTVQIPYEFKDDINFLLTEAIARVRHPDILSKLVYNEYIKPNLEDTLKRLEIGDECGIYKLTSLKTGKCYVGKSTNLRTRIINHFKGSLGITAIADQAIHHAMLEEGLDGWMIEKLCECTKEELNEKEKFYIEFFHAQEFGYNKRNG